MLITNKLHRYLHTKFTHFRESLTDQTIHKRWVYSYSFLSHSDHRSLQHGTEPDKFTCAEHFLFTQRIFLLNALYYRTMTHVCHIFL